MMTTCPRTPRPSRLSANIARGESVGAFVVGAGVVEVVAAVEVVGSAEAYVVVAAADEVVAAGSADVVVSVVDPPHAVSVRMRAAVPASVRMEGAYARRRLPATGLLGISLRQLLRIRRDQRLDSGDEGGAFGFRRHHEQLNLDRRGQVLGEVPGEAPDRWGGQ